MVALASIGLSLHHPHCNLTTHSPQPHRILTASAPSASQVRFLKNGSSKVNKGIIVDAKWGYWVISEDGSEDED